MTRKSTALIVLLAGAATCAGAQDPAAVIGAASRAMGADGLTSITYSGSAASVNFGQTKSISGPYTFNTTVTNYTRSLDLAQPASRASGTTLAAQVPGFPAPQPGALNQNIGPNNAAWTQQLEIWTTPWGFLKGAAANNASVARARNLQVVSWMTPQKAPSGAAYTVKGYINDQNLVQRVETWVEHPILGDLHVDAEYSDYRDYGGVKVPGKIVQKRAGWPTFEATITSAQANPANIAQLMTPPPPPQRAGGGGGRGAAAPPTPGAEKLADGVYRITGGYIALAIEFKDHILVLEGGQNEARGLAVIAEAKKAIPNKPVRYVVNTHPHFDHASGLAPFVAEGTTIITHDNNRRFLDMALGSPRSLVGDVLSKAGRKPRFETVGDRKVLRDDTHTVELHHVRDLEHSNGMLVAYLPRERILFTADFNLPAAGQPVSPFFNTLAANVDRLKLDYEAFVPVHPPNPDRPLTRADITALLRGSTP